MEDKRTTKDKLDAVTFPTEPPLRVRLVQPGEFDGDAGYPAQGLCSFKGHAPYAVVFEQGGKRWALCPMHGAKRICKALGIRYMAAIRRGIEEGQLLEAEIVDA